MAIIYTLVPSKAPNLPLAPDPYSSAWVNQLNNVLRLYFNTIDNFLFGLSGNTGMLKLGAPYGAFHDTTTQTAAAATATAITFNSTDISNGVARSTPTSRVIIANAGIYNIQFSLQLSNPSAQIDDVTVWFRLNGVDIPNSASLIGVPNKHGAINGHTILALNLMLAIAGGDYIELYWTTDDGSSAILTYPSSATPPIHPVSPAAILTVTFVSAIPS